MNTILAPLYGDSATPAAIKGVSKLSRSGESVPSPEAAEGAPPSFSSFLERASRTLSSRRHNQEADDDGLTEYGLAGEVDSTIASSEHSLALVNRGEVSSSNENTPSEPANSFITGGSTHEQAVALPESELAPEPVREASTQVIEKGGVGLSTRELLEPAHTLEEFGPHKADMAPQSYVDVGSGVLMADQQEAQVLVDGRVASLDDALLLLAASDSDGVSEVLTNQSLPLVDQEGPSLRSVLLEAADVLRSRGLQLSIQTERPTFQTVGEGGHEEARAILLGGDFTQPTESDSKAILGRFRVLELQVQSPSTPASQLVDDNEVTLDEEAQNSDADTQLRMEHLRESESAVHHSYDGGKVQGVGFLRLVETQSLRPFASGLERIQSIEQARENLAQTQVSRISIQMSELGADARLQVGLVGGKTVHAKIIIPGADARESITSHLEHLKLALEQRGYDVGRIRVLAPSSLDVSPNTSGRDSSDNASSHDSGAQEWAFDGGDEQHGRRQRQRAYEALRHFFYEKHL